MTALVPLLVRGEIRNRKSAPRSTIFTLRTQLRRHRHRHAVGQREEDDVRVGPDGFEVGFFGDVRHETPQVRKDLAVGLGLAALGRQVREAHLGVADEQPDELPTTISGGSNDADANWHMV